MSDKRDYVGKLVEAIRLVDSSDTRADTLLDELVQYLNIHDSSLLLYWLEQPKMSNNEIVDCLLKEYTCASKQENT